MFCLESPSSFLGVCFSNQDSMFRLYLPMSPLECCPQSVWRKTPENPAGKENTVVTDTSSLPELVFSMFTWDSSVTLLETVVKVSF